MPPTGPEAVAAYQAAVRWATHWSQRWFEDRDGKDRFDVDGISAGWSTHVEAFLILREVALDSLGLNVGRRFSMAVWLKAHGHDRAVRSARLRVMRARRAHQSAMAAVISVPTPSMAEPAAIVTAAAGSDGAVAIADHRAAPFLAKRSIMADTLVVPFRDERRALTRALATLRDQWAELSYDKPAMPLEKQDLATPALRALHPLVHRSMPWLGPEAQAVERFLVATQPHGVALASDQHRIERLAVATARRLGIRSVVLQHGLPQERIGYLPVVADCVAAWSRASRDWFMADGTQATSISVTGNPRLDELAAHTPARRATSAPVILLTLGQTARATNEALLADVMASLEFLPNARLIVKLHPGQSDWAFVGTAVRNAGARKRIEVRRFEPLYPLLAAATVVVVHRSSVAVEALASRRPVIVHRAGPEATTADLELAALDLTTTDTPHAIARSVTELHDRRATDRYLADRAAALDHIVGPLDGRSTERILELLMTRRSVP